jgi:diguanylate cyclase (GGDEF)-like protein
MSTVAWLRRRPEGGHEVLAIASDRKGAFADGAEARELGLAAGGAGVDRPLLINPDVPIAVRLPCASGSQRVGGAASTPVAGGFLWVDRESGPVLEVEMEALADAVRLVEDLDDDRGRLVDAVDRATGLVDVVEGVRAILATRCERDCIGALLDLSSRMTSSDAGVVVLVTSGAPGCAVVAGTGPGRDLVGRAFDPSPGLVGLAIRSGATVPTSLRFQSPMRSVLGDGADLGAAHGEPVLVHPVQFGSDAIGALALVRGAFDGDGMVHGVRTLSEATALLVHQFRLRERVAHDAMFDGLTGLYNRPALMKHLAETLAFCRRHRADLSLLMIDADHFKQVNDLHGHLVGDMVLRFLSDTVRRTLRESDFAGRYGGEEFAIALPHTPVDGARIVAERLRGLCAASPVPAGGARLTVTVSIGVAALKPGMRTVEDLVSVADGALYEAKRTGRNKVVVRG